MAEEEKISFFYEDIIIPGLNEVKVREWIMNVVVKEEASVASLQYIFCNDDLLKSINIKYLNHDTLTDIITFNYNDEFDGIAGDIFISYERVKANALEYGVDIFQELHRVIIHGVLHLLGYDDAKEEELSIIRSKENYYLTLLS